MLGELVANERGYQWLDAARAQRDEPEACVETQPVIGGEREQPLTGHVDQGHPENRAVLAEKAVRQPAAQQWKEIDADDEGVEHVLRDPARSASGA